MATGKMFRGLMSLVMGGACLLALDAHAFRSEGDAYEACRTAIKRGFDEWRELDFDHEYGRGAAGRAGGYEFFINLERVVGSRHVPYRARCSAEGFGAVDALQVESGISRADSPS